MTEQEALWKEDAEEMTKMLFWVHEETKKMSYVHCYMLQDGGILFMVSEAVDRSLQLFMSYDTLFGAHNCDGKLNIEEKKLNFNIHLEITVPHDTGNSIRTISTMLEEYLVTRFHDIDIKRLDINEY